MIKRILSLLISFSIIPIAVYSVQRFSSFPIGGTSIWWAVQVVVLSIFIVGAFYFFDFRSGKHLFVFYLYLAWVVFSISRGFFVAEIYWDWKGLISNIFALLIPVIVFIASNKYRLQSLLSVFVKYALPLFILFIPFLSMGSWGWYLFPVTFLMLFFPAMNLKWKIMLLLISFIAMFGDISARSHLVKFGVPIFILALYYFRFYIESVAIIKVLHKIFMLTPWVLFFLAVTGTFNVFKIKDYVNSRSITESVTAEGQQEVTEDSRTFMYREVLNSAEKFDYWLIGRSPARGNETEAFGDEKEEITGRRERLRNEANIPNVFTWMGVIGVILYFLVFWKASTLAIHRSNNIYSKLVGMFVTIRWMYAWVEDPYLFDMNSLVLWFMIGFCFSESFRKMNNLEVKFWARGIFDRKYNIYMSYLNKNIQRDKFKLRIL